MSYGKKYILTHKDQLGTTWTADIYVDGYSGASSYLTGTGDPIELNYDTSEHFTHTPIKSSSLILNLIETTDDTFWHFFTRDKYAKVKLYQGSDLYWQGWSVATGYSSPYNVCPKPVSLTFICGLSMLKNHKTTQTIGKLSLKTFFGWVFNAIGLETSVFESVWFYDALMNTSNPFWDQVYLDGLAFYNSGEDKKESNTEIPQITLYEALERILTAMRARIYQKDGCWYMDQIDQFTETSITYKRYNASLTYQASAAEDRGKDITAASGSPRLVPINHSMRKEIDYPFSEFTIKSNYNLNKNLIKYPHIQSAWIKTGTFNYNFEGNKLTLEDPGYNPELQGLMYPLGYIDFTSVQDNIMKFTIAGSLKGRLRIKLYVVTGGSPDDIYYYTNSYEGGGYDLDGEWGGYIPGMAGLCDLLYVDHSNYEVEKAFSETVEISKDAQTYSGQMYLMICPPYNIGLTQASVNIELDTIKLDYLECTKDVKTLKLTADDKLMNTKEIDLHFYSHPEYFKLLPTFEGGWSEVAFYYENPQCVYPGLFYRLDGAYYIPIITYTKSTGGGRKLDRAVVESIMTFYSIARRKVFCTLKGNVDFGDVLDYDSRRYMIAEFSKNVKRGDTEVTLLQVSETAAFLIDENDDYVVTEDGGNIIIQ